MGSQDTDILSIWANQARHEALTSRDRSNHNFLEISNLPKSSTSRSLISLLVIHTKLTPKKVDICVKNDHSIAVKQVALVEYRSEREAFLVADRLRRSVFGRKWDVKIIKNPAFTNAEDELLNQWLK